MIIDELSDGFQQFLHIAVHTAAKPFFCQMPKESLDHVEPGAAGRRKVNVETGMPLEPALHCGMYMRG